MVDVKRVKLPGVGVLHTFVTDGGGKVGVITHRSGSSDLITFSDAEDGAKATKVALRLDDDEAHTLAELLGGTRITESLANLDSIPGLTIDWFHVVYDDHIAGQTSRCFPVTPWLRPARRRRWPRRSLSTARVRSSRKAPSTHNPETDRWAASFSYSASCSSSPISWGVSAS
jgi:hypothetical protein